MITGNSTIADIEKQVRIRRKKKHVYSNFERGIINEIQKSTDKGNLDNISRTKSYAGYFQKNNDIKWSFLASMVSRNAGWNMTDLEGEWFPKVLTNNERKMVFLTYERANWLIFSDAYPQLLIYQYSKEFNIPLFYLLKSFSVSTFIEAEWEYYWRFREGKRLIASQIINEQNIIQMPVIEQPIYKRKVFRTLFYNLQDYLHFSSVVFPTLGGRLYGFSVHDFTNLNQRIELGKKLAELLFDQKLFASFYQFSKKVEHTGSRFDYERFIIGKKFRNTPFLRTTYPVIKHHRDETKDWYRGKRNKRWFHEVKLDSQLDITDWYLKKQKQLQAGILLKELF
ncbi:DUF2515 domain-containing protein [Fredinandcohnia sp. 179-A 10B2 NHS]|uniref:DUF2515 domain-containing protein n=1 Tax=Fredinandcohnia sp. 179-A 10B2 NHS TaxID=3235176 RepID=UPI00399FFCC0